MGHRMTIRAKRHQVDLRVHPVAGTERGQFPDMVHMDEVTPQRAIALLEVETAYDAGRAVMSYACGPGGPIPFITIDEYPRQGTLLVCSVRPALRQSVSEPLLREQVRGRGQMRGPQLVEMGVVRRRHSNA